MPNTIRDVWFIRRFLDFGYALLFDEAAAQRYIAGALFLVGGFLDSGGVIPFFEEPVPLPWPGLFRFGKPLMAAGVWLGAAGTLPQLRTTVAGYEADRARDNAPEPTASTSNRGGRISELGQQDAAKRKTLDGKDDQA